MFCLLEINTGSFNEAIENKAVKRNLSVSIVHALIKRARSLTLVTLVTYSNGKRLGRRHQFYEQVLLIVITLLYTNTDFVVFIKVVFRLAVRTIMAKIIVDSVCFNRNT